MTHKTVVTAAALVLLSAIASPLALAGSASVVANVTRVLVIASDTFGGCMAQLSVDPQSVLPLCAKNWVTFSCTGTFTEPVRAYRMLDQAQLGARRQQEGLGAGCRHQPAQRLLHGQPHRCDQVIPLARPRGPVEAEVASRDRGRAHASTPGWGR